VIKMAENHALRESRDALTQALHEITSALLGKVRLSELGEGIVEKSAEILNAEAASLFLIEKDKDGIEKMRMKAGYGPSRELVGKAEYEKGEGVTGKIWESGKPINSHLGDIKQYQEKHNGKGKYDHVQWKKSTFKSLYCVPLKIGEEVVGILKVENKKGSPDFFTPQDEQILEIFASLFALEIENARLKEEESKEMIDALYKISSVLAGKIELTPLLNRIVETSAKILKAEACSLFLADENEQLLRMKAGVGYSKNLVDVAVYKRREGITGSIWETGDPFRGRSQEEHRENPAWRGKYDAQQWTDGKEFKSFFGVPLKVEDRVLGVLKVENRVPDENHPEDYFTDRDEQMLEILASTIGLVIDLEQTQSELIERARLAGIGESAAGVAHQMRQGLAIISGDAQLLMADLDGTKYKDNLSGIIEGIERLNYIIKTLLNYAKPFQGELSKCIVKDMLSQCLLNENIIEKARSKEIEIKLIDRGDAKNVHVKIDPNLMGQVFDNLVNNSIDAISSEGTISVETEYDIDSRRLKILFKDTGCGIDRLNFPDIMDIFKPFKSNKPLTSTGGIGLGLSLVEKILTGHKGEIEAQSAEGKGTTFTITLPLFKE
jgi:signal transduction histidine kinase